MSMQTNEPVEQKLSEIETETMFELLELLEKRGWGYGVNSSLMRGVFIGPNDEFDLWPSMRTGKHTLQWTLQYPSTAGQTDRQPRGSHTLLWGYRPGASDDETTANFLSAALSAAEQISALPRN